MKKRGRPKTVPDIPKTCLHCQVGFEVMASEARRGGGKFCSHSCRAKYWQRDGGMNWRGGTMRHRGYILEWAPNHPSSVKGYVPQHRLVVERSLGRYLTASEVVHHRNHIKYDNRIENLEVMSPGEHAIEHHTKIILNYQGESLPHFEVIKRLGITRSSFSRLRRARGYTHQETLDHYLRHGKKRGPK